MCSVHAQCVVASCLIEYHLVRTEHPRSESGHDRINLCKSNVPSMWTKSIQLDCAFNPDECALVDTPIETSGVLC